MESITEQLKFSHYYNGDLVNNPTPIPGQKEPQCCFFKQYREDVPLMSVIMPIHNQERIIKKNLESIITYTEGLYEIIVILDDCEDSTKEIVLAWAEGLQTTNITGLIIIETFSPLFETTCDNIGFRVSRARYSLEIQADMEMVEQGYNLRLLQPFLTYPNVLGVSGRCATGFFNYDIGYGKLGELIEEPLDRNEYQNTFFYTHETCCRGPLLFDNEKLKLLGYLDEKNFYLDDSDHDLFARGFYYCGFICGYIPIEFKSPLEDGSTRKERNQKNKDALEIRKSRSNGGFLEILYIIREKPDLVRYIQTNTPKETSMPLFPKN